MSTLRAYSADKDMTLAQLEEWLNYLEHTHHSKLAAVRRNVAVEKTVGEIDIDLDRPAKAIKVQMGHVPPQGSDPIQGKAYVMGQPTDVTVSRV